MGEGKDKKKDKKEKKAAATSVGDVQAVTDFLIKPDKSGPGTVQARPLPV